MNNNSKLQNFYNKKYKHNLHEDVTFAKMQRYPKDRFEAAVYYGESGESILDVGCGSGNVLLGLKDKYNECVGLEFSKERFRQLNITFSDINNVSIIHGDIEEGIPELIGKKFDTILIVDVIEHLLSPISTIKYLNGLLKPKGRVVIISPNIAKWTRRIKLLFGQFPSTSSLDEGLLMHDKKKSTELYDEGHLHYFTYRSLRKILKERASFKKVLYGYYGRPVLFTRFLPFLFSECVTIGIK